MEWREVDDTAVKDSLPATSDSGQKYRSSPLFGGGGRWFASKQRGPDWGSARRMPARLHPAMLRPAVDSPSPLTGAAPAAPRRLRRENDGDY
jgi:hypothetical protein